jgi:hypothetical protein
MNALQKNPHSDGEKIVSLAHRQERHVERKKTMIERVDKRLALIEEQRWS